LAANIDGPLGAIGGVTWRRLDGCKQYVGSSVLLKRRAKRGTAVGASGGDSHARAI